MSNIVKFLAIFPLISYLLTGCQLTGGDEDKSSKQRATLIDLANKQEQVPLDKVSLSKVQRAEKLAEIYQSILTLEPDVEIRTQVEYRLVQMDSEAYENLDFDTLNQQQTDDALSELVNKYQGLLTRYPNRDDNELIQYQLAKTLDLQGKLDESLVVMESLLTKYPNSRYLAELNFRRAEIYYSLADYSSALMAYQQVITAENNEKYHLNSIYMSGWALFKLDKLEQADIKFIELLELVITDERRQFTADDFSFEQLNNSQLSLVDDAQRVLNISLSQQKQATSLVELVSNQKNEYLYLYRHILFKNLARFLIEKELIHDAELTYLAYINLVDNTSVDIWSARFSLDLLNLYKKQGKYSAARALKQRYVLDYGLKSTFFLKASTAQQDEVTPYLLKFSYQHARSLYAKAQTLAQGKARVEAFTETANWLNRYLTLAKQPIAEKFVAKVTKSLVSDQFLYADASFEAQAYSQALLAYHAIAYRRISSAAPIEESPASPTSPVLFNTSVSYASQYQAITHKKSAALSLEAAYATTLTIRKILQQAKAKPREKPSKAENKAESDYYQQRLTERLNLDKLFIHSYPTDSRSLALATFGAEYAFSTLDFDTVKNYSDFVLQHYQADENSIKQFKKSPRLNKTSLKQVQIVSQLQANSYYQQKQYQQAEPAYSLALNYVKKKSKLSRELSELLASCIYFQGQALHHQFSLAKLKGEVIPVKLNLLAEQAIGNYLRIFTTVQASKYAVTAQFDAANLLLEQQHWQRATKVLISFKKRYPKHEYSRSIAAKLTKSYEEMQQWELAAQQLLLMANDNNSSLALKKEAQYTAAQYYFKAGNIAKAIAAYRTYAHQYPKPFDVAQEVRFKLSGLYKQSKQVNKQYFWYRKVISFHDKQTNLQSNKQDKLVTSSMLSRSTYLASVSALGLGRAHQQTFKWAKLKIPLNKSLKTKQKSMKAAIGYYQKVLGYQIAEFVPNATFNLAEMYRQLAADVMSSERPRDLDELALEEYEILLEEIAYPFEEKAIEIHASNAERAWQNIYDKWVGKSFKALAKLDPVQFDKQERVQNAVSSLH